MGRAAKLKQQRKEFRQTCLISEAGQKAYTQEQVEVMLKEAYRQGWEARNKDIKQAVRQEVGKRVDEFFDLYDYHVLYMLHRHLGFGLKRLKDFYMAFGNEHKALRDYYELEDAGEYLPKEMMLRMGVDLQAWAKEAEEDRN